MSYRASLLCLSLCASLGCAPERPASAEVPKTPAVVTPPVAQAEPAALVAPKPAEFSVQEWGLVSYVTPNTVSVRSGPGPLRKATAAQPMPMKVPVIKQSSAVARKPVIYLKPDAAWSEATPISVEVQFQGAGRLREVWPTPNNGAQPAPSASFVWDKLRITSKACEAGWGPKADSPACKSLTDGDECEGAQLESWVPQTPRCLDVNGIPAGALVYNGTPADTKPVLEQTSPGVWKNTSAHALGALLIQHQGALYGLDGLAAGAQWSVNDQDMPAAVVQDALAWTRAKLGAQGLGAQESEDFMRAWSQMLGELGSWQVFGFLSVEAIESIATLTITPSPSKVTRVMALTVAAPPPAAGVDAKLSKKHAAVQIGKPQVVGGIDRAIVRRVVRHHINELRYCYEQALLREPELKGEMAINFIISQRGVVPVAEVPAPITKNKGLERCITTRIRSWMFPSLREGAIAKVQLPLTFSR